MIHDPVLVLIAKTLCRAAGTRDGAIDCPYCDRKGRCETPMWQTFMGEATAVQRSLKAAGIIKAATLLPGLGGFK